MLSVLPLNYWILDNVSELQLRWVFEDNSEIIYFLILNKNICCDPSLESSQ